MQTLAGGPRHCYAIARFIESSSASAVLVEEGSLYPALYRMERRGWIESGWGMSELGRKAKFYRLTVSGRKHLNGELRRWQKHTNAAAAALGLERS